MVINLRLTAEIIQKTIFIWCGSVLCYATKICCFTNRKQLLVVDLKKVSYLFFLVKGRLANPRELD